MNLFLLRKDAIDPHGNATLTGRQARHVTDVLHGQPGQALKIGQLGGQRGTGIIISMSPDEVIIETQLDRSPPPPAGIHLLLALPRPKVLKRLWAPLAALGVKRIVITNAAKVERQYFDTHWLDPTKIEERFCEGLEQAGDTILPEVTVIRRLKPFLQDDLSSLFPDVARQIAHPSEDPLPSVTSDRDKDILLAVGPEGGWTDFELQLFSEEGFKPFSLGTRTLRTDTACVALISALAAARG